MRGFELVGTLQIAKEQGSHLDSAFAHFNVDSIKGRRGLHNYKTQIHLKVDLFVSICLGRAVYRSWQNSTKILLCFGVSYTRGLLVARS